jgi:hypothetical protein
MGRDLSLPAAALALAIVATSYVAEARERAPIPWLGHIFCGDRYCFPPAPLPPPPKLSKRE